MVKSHNRRDAFLFLLPLGLFYISFLHGPIIGSILISFSDYDIISPLQIIGFENYRWIFSDPRILGIFLTTFRLSFQLVLLHAVFGLILALAVNSLANRVQTVFRIVLYLPVVITTSSMAIAWGFLFNYDFGAINWLLQIIGQRAIPWRTSSRYVFTTISIFSIWKFVGTTFIYYYIGLRSIPEVYYEAAVIDGAGPLKRFIHITLPMLTPTIFFVFMILCIRTIQIFDEPFFLTGGGPGDSSRTINLLIYETAFQSFDMGSASAISVVLLSILVTLTVVQLYLSKKWVNYDR